MATFAQWYFRRPNNERDKQIYLKRSRMVFITGSQLRFIEYVYSWWKDQFKHFEEILTLFADEPDFWDSVFHPQITDNRLIKILRAEYIGEKDYIKFEQFKKSKELGKTHLIVKEFQKGRINTKLLKYRPFIDYSAGKFINCQRLNERDCVEFIKSELEINDWLAKFLMNFCGSQSAVFGDGAKDEDIRH